MFKFTNIAAILFMITAVNFIATVISWARRKTGYGLYFAIGMTGVTFWTLATGLDYAAVPIALKVFFAKLEYLGYHIALVFLLIFILSYAGYQELLRNKAIRTLLWVVPLSNILLAWTNDWHGWLWSDFIQSEFGDNTLIFKHGPGFLWVAGTGYILISSILLVSWLASRRGSEFSRGQWRLLFLASLIPLVGNLIYQFQPSEFDGVDWTSLLFSISSLLFLWALYGMRLLDIVPIAREKLIDGIREGMIVIDTQGRIVDFNQLTIKMIGASSDKLVGSFLDNYIPVSQSILEEQPGQEFRTELEVSDPEKRYFDVLVSPLFEGKEILVGYLVTFRDMTLRKQNELHLLQLTQAVEQSPTSIVITDIDGNIIYVNPYFTTLSGYSLDEAIGQNPRILQSGQTPSEVYQDMWQTITSGNIWKGEFLNKNKNGNLYWEQATISPVMDKNDKILNFVAIKEDITERKQAQEALQKLARTDALTGLYNRRYFFELAKKEFEKSIRYNRSLSVILIDIDFFKNVNDRYGHLVGDQTLTHFGNLLRKTSRYPDIPARYGGEEFILLLPETDCDNGKVLAERLRKLVEDSPVHIENHTVNLTVSVGVAGKNENKGPETLDHLISQADQALYKAKGLGRNRVVCSFEEDQDFATGDSWNRRSNYQ